MNELRKSKNVRIGVIVALLVVALVIYFII